MECGVDKYPIMEPSGHCEPPVDPDEPILVSAVKYCMICSDIAIMYDLNGLVMKREILENGIDVTFSELFDHLCLSMGVGKKSKGKEWDFCREPFPFCVKCEQLMHSLVALYRNMQELKENIRFKMAEAEEKYVSEDLYAKQADNRYVYFRKEALAENFNGTSAGTSLDPMSSRRRSTRLQSKLKCKSESTESIAVGNNEPVSDFEPNPSSSQAAPTTIAVLKENAGKDMKPSKETLSLLPRRQSLRIQNKKNGNREATSETSVNLAEVEVYIENAETGTASNPVLVEDENFVRITIGGAPKRKHSTSVYKNTKLKSEPPKEEQIKEETGNMNGSSKQKRGRKSKVSMAVAATVKKDDLLNGGKFASGQRGKSEMGTGLDLHCPDETISMRNCELYYTAPLIKDPLSGNIYYRTVQYVYIPEENVFQCSTCSTFIQGDSKYMLKEKFHRHYIKFHSDRFICRLCPGSNHFQNDLELHQHFGRCHQGSLHYEPNIQSTTRQQRSIIKPPRQKLSQSQLYKQRKLCTICLMPTNTFDDNQIEEHRMSHMNEEEVVVYLRVKQKDNALDVRKARQSEAKVKGQFTSDWKGDDTGSLGNKKLSGRWGRKRGPYRKSLKAEKTEGTTENWNMCPTCGQLVAHGDTGMNKHIRFHHQIDNAADADDVVVNDEKGLICHHCQMGFSSSFVFRNHLAKVHDEEVPLASSVGKTKRKRRKSSEEYTVPAHLRRASVNSQYTVQTRRSSRYFSNTQNSDENANVT